MNSSLLFVAEEEDLLAREALDLLREAGAQTKVVWIAVESAPSNRIVLTGQRKPQRFPNAHLRTEGNTVFVRRHPHKDREGFRIAVLDMAVRLGAVYLPPRWRDPEKTPKRRKREHERYGTRVF